jgi:23S rRNA (adenine2503-C2)-methyltransferase
MDIGRILKGCTCHRLWYTHFMKAYPIPNEKTSLYEYTKEELRSWLLAHDDKAAHAEAIYEGLYRLRVRSTDEIPGIPLRLKEKLAPFLLPRPAIATRRVSKDGTIKYLFRFLDGQAVEGVLLHYEHGHILCVSTQKGCRMGCDFCASSRLPYAGNLSAGEIVGQLLAVEEKENVSIRNLVYMGIGEPLDNADEVKRSLQIFTDQHGPGIGARHISVSTCGVVPGILCMAEENWPCRLAVSLHHVDDQKRSQSMPVNRKWNLSALMQACKTYTEKTGTIILFEYALIPGVNDRPADATRLIALVKDIPCRINLIGLNPLQQGGPGTDEEAATRFRAQLQQAGLFASKRKALGQDIDGACGQLRGQFIQEETK